MLRVAQIAPLSKHSPWFSDICAEMARRGYEVVAIIDSTDGDLAGRMNALGIRHYRIPMHAAENLDRSRLAFYLLQLPFSTLRLAWILRRERIDIAQAHIFVAHLLTRIASLFSRCRIISSAASPRHLEARLTRVADRLSWWRDAAIMTGCAYTEQLYLQAGAPAGRLACIYYGPPAARFNPDTVDATSFRRDLGVPPDVPLVGLVAHFYPPMRGPQAPRVTRGVDLKGHDHFLAAARIVARRFPEARFVLVGDGSNALGKVFRQSLIDSCRADGLGERIIFSGHRPDIAEVLASLDVAVQCSLTEALGGTIEALLMERPTIATRVGGMPESVRHEETGLLVPPADPEALAAAIERLLGDPQEAARMGRAGRRLMLQRFTLERTGADLALLYEGIARES
jgi:glycosyltransferase involved in cell wall biosynthesis